MYFVVFLQILSVPVNVFSLNNLPCNFLSVADVINFDMSNSVLKGGNMQCFFLFQSISRIGPPVRLYQIVPVSEKINLFVSFFLFFRQVIPVI